MKKMIFLLSSLFILGGCPQQGARLGETIYCVQVKGKTPPLKGKTTLIQILGFETRSKVSSRTADVLFEFQIDVDEEGKGCRYFDAGSYSNYTLSHVEAFNYPTLQYNKDKKQVKGEYVGSKVDEKTGHDTLYFEFNFGQAEEVGMKSFLHQMDDALAIREKFFSSPQKNNQIKIKDSEREHGKELPSQDRKKKATSRAVEA